MTPTPCNETAREALTICMLEGYKHGVQHEVALNEADTSSSVCNALQI